MAFATNRRWNVLARRASSASALFGSAFFESSALSRTVNENGRSVSMSFRMRVSRFHSRRARSVSTIRVNRGSAVPRGTGLGVNRFRSSAS